jgi:hypothetical protein
MTKETEYSINKQWKNEQCTKCIFMQRTTFQWLSGGTQGGICMQVKRDYLGWVYSDQTVIEIVRCEGWAAWAVAKSNLGGPSGSGPFRSDGSHDGKAGGWTLWAVAKRHSNLGLKGDYQAQVYSDQMVLMVVKREAELRERWPKTLKWE